VSIQLPEKHYPWPIAWAGVVEIAMSEGCRLRAYRDLVGIWTIGWGQTRGVKAGMVWTQPMADLDLCQELDTLVRQIEACLTVKANPNELAAMVSLAYNIGMGWVGDVKPRGAKNGFRQSTVLRAHNRGDKAAAARAFALWNQAGGNVIPGLVSRRAREAALYMMPAAAEMARMALDAAPATPEADAERPLTDSSIARSGAVSVATGGLAVASSVSSDIRQMAWNMNIDPLMAIGIVIAVVGGVILYQRIKQRRGGWA